MKRCNNIYPKICDINNLEAAWRCVRLGKRYDREILRFEYNFLENLVQLQNELIWKKYRIGPYREFVIQDPKERLIQYLPLRDRLVQQSLHQIIEPLFDQGFINDSYACRRGKGTHRAMRRLKYFLNSAGQKWGRDCYYLHCDIRKYFLHIDHDILYSLICRKIKCSDSLALMKMIIDSGTSSPGMPIGSLFSQLSANIYLNVVDQYVKHSLRERYYLRYMDNFIVVHHDKKHLRAVKDEIGGILRNSLRLEFNQKSTRIDKTSNGIDFVGYLVYADKVKIRKNTIKRMKKRLRCMQIMYKKGATTLDEIGQVAKSWIGHTQHADAHRMVDGLLSRYVFTRA